MQKEAFLLIGLAIGLAVGIASGFYLKSCKPKASPSDIGDRTLNYINKNFLNPKGVEGKILNISPYGENLYEIDIGLFHGVQSLGSIKVHVTRDGEILVLNLLNMSMAIEQPRVNVSIDDDPWKGNESASVVVIEFSDFACPYCAKFELETLPRIMKSYGERIIFVFRDFPVHGEASIEAAQAANCAGEQKKYWEYHNILFERQAEWYSNLTMLKAYAAELGLNLTRFEECLDSRKYESEVLKDREDGVRAGVTGTPTIFVNGRKIEGAQDFEAFRKVIEEELS